MCENSGSLGKVKSVVVQGIFEYSNNSNSNLEFESVNSHELLVDACARWSDVCPGSDSASAEPNLNAFKVCEHDLGRLQ